MILEKYSGSGNDFLITHFYQSTNPKQIANLAKELCNRNLGIGADGLIILKPHLTYAYEWLFFNSDGSYAKMCGNASRCVGHYAFKHKLAPRKHTFLATDLLIKIEVKGFNVLSNLGKFSPITSLNLKSFYGDMAYLIDTGVPHLVIFTQQLKNLPLHKTQELEQLRNLYNANINIVYKENNHKLYVHTYERGVENITLACGTGMGAACVVGHHLFQMDTKITCIPPSKEELVFFINNNEISFEGKVKYIATCII
ncbi:MULTISPECIES: diaminopimelate epimerase [unclassified Helicobacter]|uniref:diaminopimelate epimerase n=1 Tax=unclassified Helicobacter TaxID=2593540 RepID=UPI000CF14F28|nr:MULTISPECIES: diaminopimelate epimerase [unclassified Helicobacter]